MILAIILLIIGLVILIFGAEMLVKGSISLAKKLGISPLIIGLTIVAFGTSAPELTVNIISALKGNTDIAIGNIVGSNISNILLILGISAIIYPLQVKKSTTWKEIPFAILGMILIFIMGNDVFFDKTSTNILTTTDGLALLSIFIIFIYYIFGLAKNEKIPEEIKNVKLFSYPLSSLLIIAGLTALFLGGKLLVNQAVILAKLAGLSEILIGLTIVAIGTSLPELITSVIAAIHHQEDIAVGNIVGSNILNIFWVLGLTSAITPIPFSSGANFDITIGIIATIILFFAMFTGQKHKIDKFEGISFIVLYVSYIGYLFYRG